jgi:hypothetical protein
LRGRPDRLAFAIARAARQVALSAPVGVHDEMSDCLSNASLRPSGDQEGCAASLASNRASLPSAFIIQTSKANALPHPLHRGDC